MGVCNPGDTESTGYASRYMSIQYPQPHSRRTRPCSNHIAGFSIWRGAHVRALRQSTLMTPLASAPKASTPKCPASPPQARRKARSRKRSEHRQTHRTPTAARTEEIGPAPPASQGTPQMRWIPPAPDSMSFVKPSWLAAAGAKSRSAGGLAGVGAP